MVVWLCGCVVVWLCGCVVVVVVVVIIVILETALNDVSVHTAQNTDLQRQFHN